MGLAAVGGQLIGGLLIAGHLGWQACFLINVPVGIVALALIPRVVPESRTQPFGRIDGAGAVLATVGLVALVLPLIEGREHGWPAWTWLSFAASAVLLGAFAAHQRHRVRIGRQPLVDPALRREPRFALGATTTLAFYVGDGVVLPRPRAVPAAGARADARSTAGLVFTVLGGGLHGDVDGRGADPRAARAPHAACRAR